MNIYIHTTHNKTNEYIYIYIALTHLGEGEKAEDAAGLLLALHFDLRLRYSSLFIARAVEAALDGVQMAENTCPQYQSIPTYIQCIHQFPYLQIQIQILGAERGQPPHVPFFKGVVEVGEDAVALLAERLEVEGPKFLECVVWVCFDIGIGPWCMAGGEFGMCVCVCVY